LGLAWIAQKTFVAEQGWAIESRSVHTTTASPAGSTATWELSESAFGWERVVADENEPSAGSAESHRNEATSEVMMTPHLRIPNSSPPVPKNREPERASQPPSEGVPEALCYPFSAMAAVCDICRRTPFV